MPLRPGIFNTDVEEEKHSDFGGYPWFHVPGLEGMGPRMLREGSWEGSDLKETLSASTALRATGSLGVF